jgi:predicted hotdog family 3-hydroxylacyl-ACP dehydratase
MQVRQLRLAAGLMSAAGAAEVDAQGNLNGRMQIELKSQAVQGRAGLTLSGTLKEPQYRRSN